ncbi:hypothetical protein HC026_01360 [Lactobacillus sp. LC28-10]|uniref:Uncharacterized protein n=1 Tax=Secundilactobacillus angelensis TaxID=2722706 RepID=A0ABX1KUE7_9LACO|nr:DUF5776 domain-containing protein [Secundilactobacillus angelensis]MCH5461243.1 MucBP domain-containing protein [Secundilactobacillus angelensis]NLR17561.1 hypothetical protein [Secundilactobacillus angelensis]
MTKYHLNHSFNRFPSHYFYVVALVSTGLFFGHTVTTAKAATPENATPTSDTTDSTDQSASSTILRTAGTVQTESTKQQSAGNEFSEVSTNSSVDNTSQASAANPETVTATEDTTASGTDDPSHSDTDIPETTANSDPSTSTSTATLTITPASGTIPLDNDATTPTIDENGNLTTTAATTEPVTDITIDPQNATVVAPDALGVKPVGGIKLNVPVPTDGKDAIKATNAYYYTIDGDINIYNQMANYHGSLKDASDGAWQGSDYAAKIPTTANGVDPATKQYYIDEWMPDIWFQYLLWTTQYSTQYQSWGTFKTTFSKSSLSNLTNFTVTEASQQTSSTDLTATPIYTALVQTQSLEGLQYAQNLNTINFTVNSDVSESLYGGDIQSHLWDISALGEISSLRSVRFIDTSIQDISALRANSLLNNLELSFNQISDISGFTAPWTHVNSPGNPLGSARYSSISMPLLVLQPGTTSVEVSYNVKGVDGSFSHMIPSDGNDFGNEVWGQFKASTADAVSEDNHTIVFYNLLTPPAGNVGWLSAAHTFYMDGDDGSAFDVWVFIPYIISNNYGTTKVNYENLLPNGQQEEIATSTPLSGPVNNPFDVSTDPNTTYPLEWLTDKYGSNYLVLDGTGNYSDFVANNGLAKAVPVSGSYTADPQTLTVLFAPTTQLTVQRGYYQSDGQFITISPDTQVDQTLTTNLVVSDQVTTIPNFHFKSAELVATNGTSTPVTTPTLPYLTADNQLRLVYDPDQVTIPITYVDNLNHVIHPAATFSGTVIDTVSPSSTTSQLPIPDYTFDHYALNDGTPITSAVTLAELKAGLKLVYTGNSLSITVNYVDDLGQPLQTSQISGAVNTTLPDTFTTDQQINIPDYTFSRIETLNHQPIPADATYNTIREGITVVYQGNEISVPIDYKDANGNSIADESTFNHAINSPLTAAQLADLVPTIKYYSFVEAQDKASNTLNLPVTIASIRDGIQLIYSENSTSVTIEYVDPAGNPIQQPTFIEGKPSEQLTGEQIAVPELPGYTFDHFEDNNGNVLTLPITISQVIDNGFQVVYQPVKVSIPVFYVDTSGQTIAATLQVPGNYQDPFTGDSLTALQQAIPGYTFSRMQGANGAAISLPNILGELQNGIYLIYTLNSINVIPPVTPPIETPADNNHEVVPPKVIYAMKQLSLHSEVNFTADNIIMTYVKKPRIYRPRFIVLGTARDSQNRLRYLVRDINPKSDTFGLVGYVTANPEYVRSAYYHIVPTTITVINSKGINGYSTPNLTGKLAHYRQGTVLQVASIIQDRTATRFVLNNGQIVTASKLLVKMGTIPQPTNATKLNALNRYSDLNLTVRTAHFKAATAKSFPIISWDYSNGSNYHVKSLKRYQINGGYITAYSKLVKTNY